MRLHVGRKRAERGSFHLARRANVLEHQIAPFGKQLGLQSDQLVHQLPGFVVVDDVAREQGLPDL